MKQSNNIFQRTFKRLFDILFSIIVLIILSPLFLILAIWIVKDDRLPVFFKQTRSGLNNLPFEMYKLRSMKNKQTPVKSNSINKYNWHGRVPDDFVFKTAEEDNPNITPVGYYLRKYSLDELPQFINVLKGDMSVIGPRPELLTITECYDEEQRRRLDVKPGISGWAQVNGRSEMNHGEKIKNDLYYVKNISLGLDIKILFKTIIQVIIGRGSV